MSCSACQVVRELEPGLVPTSCEECEPVDLMEENEEAWELACKFPGIIKSDLTGVRADYGSALEILSELRISRRTAMLRKLDAIAAGYNDGKSKHRRRGGQRQR